MHGTTKNKREERRGWKVAERAWAYVAIFNEHVNYRYLSATMFTRPYYGTSFFRLGATSNTRKSALRFHEAETTRASRTILKFLGGLVKTWIVKILTISFELEDESKIRRICFKTHVNGRLYKVNNKDKKRERNVNRLVIFKNCFPSRFFSFFFLSKKNRSRIF